jgi:hypothetical protein
MDMTVDFYECEP